MANLKMRSYQHTLIIYIYKHWTIQLGISEIIHCNLPHYAGAEKRVEE